MIIYLSASGCLTAYTALDDSRFTRTPCTHLLSVRLIASCVPLVPTCRDFLGAHFVLNMEFFDIEFFLIILDHISNVSVG